MIDSCKEIWSTPRLGTFGTLGRLGALAALEDAVGLGRQNGQEKAKSEDECLGDHFAERVFLCNV